MKEIIIRIQFSDESTEDGDNFVTSKIEELLSSREEINDYTIYE